MGNDTNEQDSTEGKNVEETKDNTEKNKAMSRGER